MTTSPYDNLPKYIDVEVTPPPAPVVETAKDRNAEHGLQPPNPAQERPNVAHETPKPAHQRPKAAPKSPKPATMIPLTPPPKYAGLSIKNLQGCFEYILPFEESLLVPDTMPDMQKALFAEGRVDLAQPLKASYDKNDFLAGDITAYTVYRPVRSAPSPVAGPAAYNDCPIDVVKSIIPFKTDKCWAGAAGDSFRPTVTVRTITAEMINERKFIVRGELLINMSCIESCEMNVFKEAADGDLVTLKNCVKATCLDHEVSDTIEISQDITIRDDEPSPVKILKTAIDVVENHRQLTSGKLVINAAVHLDVLYIGEADDGQKKLCSLINKTDFTQFIVMDDKIDPDLITLTFGCKDISLTIDGDDRFMLQGNVTTLIRSYCNNDLDTVTDAYHKKNDLHFRLDSKDISCVKDIVSGEISAREVINPGDPEIKPATLLCGSCGISSIEGHISNDRIIIEGSMPVKILALDEEDVPFVIDHTIPVRGSLDIPSSAMNSSGNLANAGDNDKGIRIYIDASVKEFWFSEINSRQLEINTVLSMKVWLFSEENFCTIEDLCFAEEESTPSRRSMALYVVGDGDTLWDVAKRYKADMDSLAVLNDLDPAKPLPSGAKLFIAK
ncbi:MAG: DUF3794 domain-containing protein [Firmicutes bacterium]|nr:DUF3794 domain-containing protein [Bacillota bacterium]MBR6800111.1 DUF3794 domain-containing protein [Bacillota bacterium]